MEYVGNYRMTQWSEILQDKSASGLTVREYCESNGLSINSFYYWQRKLRSALIALSENGQERGSGTLVPHGFTEVNVYDLSRSMQREVSRAPGHGTIHIELNGMQIRTDSGYPVANLAELLKGLVSP